MLHPSAPDPVELVIELGGVVRTRRLRERGISRRVLEAAIASQRLIRVRRGWVASKEADPVLVARRSPDAAYNGHTSVDPAITGELSEEHFDPSTTEPVEVSGAKSVEPSGAGP